MGYNIMDHAMNTKITPEKKNSFEAFADIKDGKVAVDSVRVGIIWGCEFENVVAALDGEYIFRHLSVVSNPPRFDATCIDFIVSEFREIHAGGDNYEYEMVISNLRYTGERGI
jgi:hypothetical protein